MPKYIRILQSVDIYATHDAGSSIIRTAAPGELFRFNREKRRNGINWMEIYPHDDAAKGYLRKNKNDLFVCEYAELDDDEALGFGYRSVDGQPAPSFLEAFSPLKSGQTDATHTIQLKRSKDIAKNEGEFITFTYDPTRVEVSPFTFYKNETFHVTHKDVLGDSLVQVDDLNGRKGYLLPKTAYTETADKWMLYVIYAVMILVVLGIIGVCLLAGWIVIGGILLIPGLIVAFIVALVLKLVVSILGGIFNLIRKRL